MTRLLCGYYQISDGIEIDDSLSRFSLYYRLLYPIKHTIHYDSIHIARRKLRLEMSEFNVALPKRTTALSARSPRLVNRFGIIQTLTARRWLLPLVMLLCLLSAAPSAFASTVITLGANCSLANAIRSFNGDAQVAPANQCAAGSANTRDLIKFVADVEISEALPAITNGGAIEGHNYSLSTPSADTEGENSASYDFNLLTFTNGSITLRDLTLSGAEDSAIKAEEAENGSLDLHISNCEFSDNTAATNGGAIFVSGGADVTVHNSALRQNSAPNGSGGAIYAKNSFLYVRWSNITESSAKVSGGAIHFEIESGELYKLVMIQGNSFTSNQATDNDDTTNTAENGGAIFVSNTETTIVTGGSTINDNSFSDNSGRNGGAIYVVGGKLQINNNTIDEGEASAKGGGIYIAGGPVYLRHNTIVNNQAANGGGMAIFTNAQDSAEKRRVNLFNSIVAENTDTDTTDTTCFRDALNRNEGNIIEDSNCPAAQAADDGLLLELVEGGSAYDDSKADRYYRLLEGSPAIDSGDNGQDRIQSTDQTGRRRPQGSGYDIGAYEFVISSPEPSPSSPETTGGNSEVESEGGTSGSDPAGGSTGGQPGSSLGQSGRLEHTCVSLSEAENGIQVSATYGLQSGVQCQELDARGIGIRSVLEAGFVKAVDVWGYVEQGVEVCFDTSGPLLFLDATTAPRTIYSLPSTVNNGQTCGLINRPGSIVLQPSGSAMAGLPSQPVPGVATPRTHCMVTTTAVLNFRDGPNGNWIGMIPQRVTLTVLGSADGWYEVDWYGRAGWISAAYAIPRNCG